MQSIEYTIDASDKICAVNSAFWSFASENGSTLAETMVLGTHLFEHVSDEATEKAYRILHQYVRESGVELKFPYRCDSPDCQRSMLMRISPRAEAELGIFNKVLREIKREAVAPLSFAGDSVASGVGYKYLLYCSFCNRASLPGHDWGELVVVLESVCESVAFDTIRIVCQPCAECIRGLQERVLASADQMASGVKQFDLATRHAVAAANDAHRRLLEIMKND